MVNEKIMLSTTNLINLEALNTHSKTQSNPTPTDNHLTISRKQFIQQQ